MPLDLFYLRRFNQMNNENELERMSLELDQDIAGLINQLDRLYQLFNIEKPLVITMRQQTSQTRVLIEKSREIIREGRKNER